ncbi:MAG: hypothetical protein H7Z41_18520, partial [Cytophagales bacterium]|nr:hypothetical protein [Armatimonadota bacterium]
MAILETEGPRPESRAVGPESENPDAVLISETADMLAEEENRFGRREIRVTRSSVRLYDEAGTLLFSVPMADIKSARTEPLVGGARLELTTTTGVLPVATFSASVAARFSEMARGIEQLAKGEPLAIKLVDEKTRCEKCGRRLPEKDGKCPACVKRAAVFGRIMGYLNPYRLRAGIVVAVSLLSAASS